MKRNTALNTGTRKMKNTKHQEPMINRKPRLQGDIEEDESD